MHAGNTGGGLHSARTEQGITCTPKVRLEDCIVPKQNRALHVRQNAIGGLHSAKTKQSITCTPKVRLEDCIEPKENRALHVRQKFDWRIA